MGEEAPSTLYSPLYAMLDFIKGESTRVAVCEV